LQVANSYLEIKSDGLYDCNLLGTKEAGNWKFDKSTMQLFTKPAGGNEDRLRVLRVGHDSLTLGEDERNCLIFNTAKGK